MMAPTASIDLDPVQSKEAADCQRQIEFIRELKEQRPRRKRLKSYRT